MQRPKSSMPNRFKNRVRMASTIGQSENDSEQEEE